MTAATACLKGSDHAGDERQPGQQKLRDGRHRLAPCRSVRLQKRCY